MGQIYAQKLLLMEYKRRKGRNSQYSLRALARDLSLPRTTVMDVAAGKRKLSPQNIQRLAEKLKLEKSEVEALRSESQKTWTQLKNDLHRKTLSEDDFAMIHSWENYAILNLSQLKNHQSAPKWIAGRLGIPVETVKTSLALLKKMQLLKIEKGRLIRLAPALQTTSEVPSRYIREQHRQFLNLAADSLDNVDPALRNFTSVTVAIDSAKIAQAKKMQLQFQRQVVAFLQSGEPDAVYTISTQLFPTRQF